MTNFKIDFTNNTITMTKAVAEKASKYGSEEYRELMQVRKDFPTFEVKVIATPKRKTEFKGLNYAFMKQYIMNCKRADKDEIQKDFEELTTKIDGCDVASFGEVRQWFLETFPDIKNHRKNHRAKMDNILSNPRKTVTEENNTNIVSIAG